MIRRLNFYKILSLNHRLKFLVLFGFQVLILIKFKFLSFGV